MFSILRFIPEWFSWVLLIAGLSGYFLTYLAPKTSLTIILKTFSCILVAAIIFTFGVKYNESIWQEKITELQTKVEQLTLQSNIVNQVIKEKVVTKTQIIKQRGDNIVEYIDREVIKINNSCTIPSEFINAHDSAAEIIK